MDPLNGPPSPNGQPLPVWVPPDGPGVRIVGPALPVRTEPSTDTRVQDESPAKGKQQKDQRAGDAPDPDRRGPAYWFEELTGIVPLAAPLLIEAVIHARFAEHVIDLENPYSLLFPAAIGLGAVRVAFYLDRARLRKDPTGLIRFGLYLYMAAGFALSFFYLQEFNQVTGQRLADGVTGDVLPAIVVGCAQAAGVLLWELRTRQRRREVERVQRQLDEDRLRRAVSFPIWHIRMIRWSIATGERDWSRVVAAFAPLILAQKSGAAYAKWPGLAGEPVPQQRRRETVGETIWPVFPLPAATVLGIVSTQVSAPAKAERPAPKPKPAEAPKRAAPRPAADGQSTVRTLRSLEQSLSLLRAAFPDREPSHREVFDTLGINSKSQSAGLKNLIRAERAHGREPAADDDKERSA